MKANPTAPFFIYLITGELLYTFKDLDALLTSAFAKRWKKQFLFNFSGEFGTRLSTNAKQQCVAQLFYITQQSNFGVDFSCQNHNQLARKSRAPYRFFYDREFWCFTYQQSVFEADYTNGYYRGNKFQSDKRMAEIGALYNNMRLSCERFHEMFVTENYLLVAETYEHPEFDAEYYFTHFFK